MRKLFLMLLVCLGIMSYGVREAESVTLKLVQKDDYSAVMQLVAEGFDETSVSALNFELSDIPTGVAYLGQSDKSLDYNGSKFILWGINKTAIENGIIAEFTFPYTAGTTGTIKFIGDYCFSNPDAEYVEGEVVDGDYAVFFRATDCIETAMAVIGKSDKGIDYDDNGVIDALDVQAIANRVK